MSSIKWVCATCGSDDIEADANVSWNVDSQRWEIVNIYDSTYCRDCGCERDIKEEEIPDAVDNGGHRIGWPLSRAILDDRVGRSQL